MPADERARARPMLPGTIQVDMTRGRLLRVRQEGDGFKALCWRRQPPPNPAYEWHFGEGRTLRRAIADATGLELLSPMTNELVAYTEARLLGAMPA